MSLSLISLIDLVFRAMVLGQLVLLAVLLVRYASTILGRLVLASALSIAALVVLTAPIPEEHEGIVRSVLLLFTDAFAFLFWLLIRYLFEDDFRPGRWPRFIKVILGAGLVIYVYALGIKRGDTPLHDLIHLCGLVLIVHAAFIILRGFNDDLLNKRRRARIIVLLGISLYSAVLVIFELIDERYRNAPEYGLVNAIVFFLMLTLIIPRLLRLVSDRDAEGQDTDAQEDVCSGPAADPADSMVAAGVPQPRLTAADLKLAATLDEFIAQRGHLQNGLTIKSLARQLDCPEHRLRRLINQTRGYRNFNAMLNDLRIDEAMSRLVDPKFAELPILSIGLDLGYDSIGPFNRAFKERTGQTPGEYRRSVNNRR